MLLRTPVGIRYDQARARAYPFDKLVEGMLQPKTLRETANLMRKAIKDDIEASILINNRASCNAPIIAKMLVKQFTKSLGEG